MVNPNIQAPIPLAGRGLVDRITGDYASGEYRRLMDVEIDEQGHLVSRRSITPTNILSGSYDTAPYTNAKIIGYWGAYVIVADNVGIWAISSFKNNNRVKHLNISDFPAGTFASSPVHRPVAFHRYNRLNHIITFKAIASNNSEFHVYRSGSSDAGPTATTLGAMYADTAVISGLQSVPNFVTSIVHKDRLWIFTTRNSFANSSTAYFSKATDFTDFTAPNGGFFSFPDDFINDVISYKDSIYVICDSAIYLITYATDPNIDATVRKCGSNIGGDSACLYEDVVYFTKNNDLYAINGTNITKMFSLDINVFKDTALSAPETIFYVNNLVLFYTKIVPFADYIVFLRHTRYFYTISGVADTEYLPRVPYSVHNAYDSCNYALTEMPPGMVFLNMKNGSTHAVMFSDKWEQNNKQKQGWPADIISTPTEDWENDPDLYILTTVFDKPTHSSKSNLYVMPFTLPAFTDKPAKDIVLNYTTNASKEVNHTPEIEINSFTPDGSEYFIKKFRTLLIMGKLPYYGCRISYAYDNQPFSTPRALDQTALIDNVNARAPFPMRLPLNQRARSITIKLDMDPTAALSTKQDISITDMRILWSYSKRAPATDTKG